jgi:cytochrome P450
MSVDTSEDAPRTPLVDFDHHTLNYRDNWPAISDTNLKCPVAYTSAHGGFWLVSDHANVTRVSRDDATFSSAHNMADPSDPRQGIAIPPAPILSIPLELDPPVYNAYRRMLSPYFSPTVTKAGAPFVRQVVDAFLDRACASGRIDFVFDLANPVPAVNTMKLVGLPVENWHKYAGPMHRLSSVPPTDPEWARCMGAMQQLVGELTALVPRLREEPGDDLLSGLATADINGAPLSDDEVALIGLVVMQGGVDTTTALLANTLWWLDEHPEQRQRLIDEPGLMKHATEEFLRMFSPIQGLARTASRDVVLGGRQVREGDRLLLSFAAANRDATVFPDPSEVMLDRASNPHTSFGMGIHRCAGMHLARSWFQVMLQRVLDRMPDFQIDRAASRRYDNIGFVNGFVNMPATFTPSEPVGAPFPT